MSRDSKRSVGKLVVETLEMISHSNDFDEEVPLFLAFSVSFSFLFEFFSVFVVIFLLFFWGG